ncbi:hypothetical protein RBG61_03095 [Paludicola sp. MB14-C6]|uniref:CD1247 N-terminal domain-containing protein n=1 Tax=Paludihabitans sp. MB14-C6 TaxID=3070656 RepID=UPI0027DD2916|nr:CD1247 N-terminal domain-containing protein [Paludicola sp. MB14-C6]WMJ23668.1 hypothetical protein RBG61_03095 [Paludicola sp. MB14-C6]
MSMMESVAYLKGLAQGLDIDESSKEGKLLLAIVDVLDEMAESINDIEDVCDEFDELIDIIDEDLGDLENDFYGISDDEDEDEMLDDDELYEVTCPNCDDVIYLDEDMLLEGDMDCPNCGQKLEFDYDGCNCGCDDDCGCDCGCDHNHE